jgi:hypothetical protein
MIKYRIANCLNCNKEIKIRPCEPNKKYCSKECYYISCRKGNVNSTFKKGHKHSEESKLKMRLSHTGKTSGMLGKNHSENARIKISIGHKGVPSKKNKGLTKINKLVRLMLDYDSWRLKVFERDNYTCQLCNLKGVCLNAHHKKRLSLIVKEHNIKTLFQARSCKELWDINNGITLCEKCHKIIHKK